MFYLGLITSATLLCPWKTSNGLVFNESETDLFQTGLVETSYYCETLAASASQKQLVLGSLRIGGPYLTGWR
jgi:hypothetical protein